MNSKHIEKAPVKKMAAFYLWSIRNQDAIATQVRIHMWSGVASFLLATLLLPIPLEKALLWLFVFGASITAGLWIVVERRRSWLLRIQDPLLRDAAHRAMVDYLTRKIGAENTANLGSYDDNSCRYC